MTRSGPRCLDRHIPRPTLNYINRRRQLRIFQRPNSFARARTRPDIGIPVVAAPGALVCPPIEVVQGWLAKFKHDLDAGERAAIYGVLREAVPSFSAEMESVSFSEAPTGPCV
jgi:hypothetical protein